jgi:hypothetical protein
LHRTREDVRHAAFRGGRAKDRPGEGEIRGRGRTSNINAPESYTIQGEGKGGVAGFAKGGADVHLAEDGDGTLLTYEVHAKVGGKLAQLGSRLIDATARKLAAQFFDNFQAHLNETAKGPASERETTRTRNRRAVTPSKGRKT